jgi:MYXO-CTERM domain-containing protein
MSLAVALTASPAHAEPAGAILYLDRCAGGCSVEPGVDDARADTSSLIAGPATLAEFRHGDAAWSEVVECVRATYAPFAIEVTDVDPGDAPHFEAKVAGEPADIGATGIGGLAPFDCGVIDNALTFSFANIYGDVDDLCATVAQESAHAFGLEHEILCDDPMTYMDACGPKRFQDVEAPCGGYGERACECGGATQSSYRKLLEALGPAGAPVLQAGDPPCSGEECAPTEDGGCALAGGDTGAGWLVLLAILFLRRRRPT